MRCIKNFKKVCLSLLISATVLSTALPAFASEASDNKGDVYVDVWLQKEINAQPGDEFEVTYKHNDVEQKLTIDLMDSVETLSLETGSYIVTDVQYKGANDQINAYGYGVLSKFDVEAGENAYSEFILAIGTDYGNKLNRLYADVLLKQQSEFVEELSVVGQTQDGEYVIYNNDANTNETESATTVDENVDAFETEETYVINTDPNEIAASEDSDVKSEDKSENGKTESYGSRLIMKAVPLLILAAIVGIALFSIYKKNK